MIGTITPVVHGGSRCQWLTSAVLHLSGGVAGGAIVGGAMEFVGRITGGWLWILPVGLAVLYGLDRSEEARIPRLEWPRQVPASWRIRCSRPTMALAYGVALGAGVLTYVAVPSFYCLVGLALLGHEASGATLLGLFGGARTILVLIVGWRIVDADSLDRVSVGLETWSGVVRTVNAAVSQMSAGYLVGLFLSDGLTA